MAFKVLVCALLSSFLLLPCQAGAGDATKPKKRAVDDGPRSEVEIVVKRGESMGLYGRWAKIPMKSLYARADLTWGETLAAGRTLRIAMTAKERARFEEGRAAFARAREGAYAKASTELYKVRRGDSGWRIARRRGVPLDVLERLNPSVDLKKLQVGDALKVPAKGGES